MNEPIQVEQYAKAVRENVKSATTAEAVAKDVAFCFLTPSQIFCCWLDSLWFHIKCKFNK